MDRRIMQPQGLRPLKLSALAAAVVLAVGAGASPSALAAGERAGAGNEPSRSTPMAAKEGEMRGAEPRAQTETPTTAGAIAPATGALLKASDVIGKEVENRAGEHLGEIEDLAVDWGNGRVPYAVLSFGGVLDIGDKHFAVPLAAFSKSPTGDRLILDVAKEKLETMEGFDKRDWPPEIASREWGDELHARFGATPWWRGDEREPSPRAGGVRAAGGGASAEEAAPERFAAYDRNRDRYLTREEIQDDERLHERFPELDRDHDGRLSRAEFARFTVVSESGRAGGQPRSQPRD